VRKGTNYIRVAVRSAMAEKPISLLNVLRDCRTEIAKPVSKNKRGGVALFVACSGSSGIGLVLAGDSHPTRIRRLPRWYVLTVNVGRTNYADITRTAQNVGRPEFHPSY
jgi:hypothetical protein